MLRELKINGIRWVDGVDLDKTEVQQILDDYDFHELDIEASVEENQRARIIKYPNYLFIVLHFPKFIPRTKTYKLNEFNIFLGKKFLLTFRNYQGNHIDKIYQKYENFQNDEEGSDVKISSGFILYEIIQAMLEKMFKVMAKNKTDITEIEDKVFEKINSDLVEDIMIKKRNIKFLKNMFKPQVTVFHSLETAINEFYRGAMELYFEDLEDKLGYVINEILINEETIDSIEDAFISIIQIKGNRVVELLTIFGACILPLNLVTGFYGMNVQLPYQQNPYIVFTILGSSVVFMISMYIFLRVKGKIKK